jgi:cellulose synthase/poly-beta-1,6-N-acetylglucosamine synthase-like glycosyltransferase
LFDLAIVIDADTEVHPDFLHRIAIAAEAAGADLDRTVFQGRYEFAPTREQSGWFETFTIASKAAENSFVYRPRSVARLVNLLQGNGFCVPRSVLAAVPFASSSIVEDADYAIALALAGVQVRFVEHARVLSRMTRTVSSSFALCPSLSHRESYRDGGSWSKPLSICC